MNWIQNLTRAIDYIEGNLTAEICFDEVANHAYSSSSHFQLIFHVLTGLTVGEYIRNRRLSLAAQDLLQTNSKIVDVAMRYQYDAQESFSKAFTRFHGVSPSKIKMGQVRLFHRFGINVTVQGGFDLPWKLTNDFHLVDWGEIDAEQGETPSDKYKKITTWARKARGKNPGVFDALTAWLLDDSQWAADKIVENEQILMQGVFARFKEQNARLRMYLKELEPTGVVNAPVFKALDDFDRELSGTSPKILCKPITQMFANFATMQERDLREKIAGEKTGRHGVDNVDGLGFIGYLKNRDAQVQWCLFMPDLVKHQQKGFQVDSFEYKQMPAMRFIGKEFTKPNNAEIRKNVSATLDSMAEYNSDFSYDVLFMHHYGKGVDKEPWHGFWGRFMKADTPVPEGFLHWDFLPDDTNTPYLTFRSQFAYATFSGDIDAMHKREGYDSDAMYDVTRNIILGQGVTIPYPEIYWTAEVHLNGYDQPSTAYMFSVVV